MKKHTLLIMLITLCISCSKSGDANEENQPIPLTTSIQGVRDWEGAQSDNYEISIGESNYQTGDLWPSETKPIATVIRARKDGNPGILMSINNQKVALTNFSIAQYCQSLGEGWFIPSIDEGQSFMKLAVNAMNMDKWFIYGTPLDEILWIWTSSVNGTQGVAISTQVEKEKEKYYYTITISVKEITHNTFQIRAFKYY